ncbi:MAG: acylphosphatase, partial [Lachnospiraceae bacterium]|nr:acylphosphatase [Lachnospiraceae bacterium]
MTYKIYGLVQGVGFRPYVAKLADSLSLKGYVKNSGGIVTLCIIGDKKAMDDLLHRLFLLDGFSSDLPGAKVERIEEVPSDPEPEYSSFSIIESSPDSDEIRILPPDIATCPTCLSEMRDPSNRRYRHPFISCISCGPRFSIMRSLPYDRDTITMGTFSMCPSCAEEYHSLGDRRHFAQTIACPDCGPRVILISAGLPEGWARKYSFSLVNFLRGLRRLFGRRTANTRSALKQCSAPAVMLAPAGEIPKCSKAYFRAQPSGSPALAQAIEALKAGKIV